MLKYFENMYPFLVSHEEPWLFSHRASHSPFPKWFISCASHRQITDNYSTFFERFSLRIHPRRGIRLTNCLKHERFHVVSERLDIYHRSFDAHPKNASQKPRRLSTKTFGSARWLRHSVLFLKTIDYQPSFQIWQRTFNFPFHKSERRPFRCRAANCNFTS